VGLLSHAEHSPRGGPPILWGRAEAFLGRTKSRAGLNGGWILTASGEQSQYVLQTLGGLEHRENPPRRYCGRYAGCPVGKKPLSWKNASSVRAISSCCS